MENLYDYKKYAILYVDDEEKSLKAFTRAFKDDFRVLTAPSVAEGLKLLEAYKSEIAVLMSDQRMPGEKGVSLLEKARQMQPQILRMLVTAYADHDAVVSAVNAGAIYRYVTKPWDPPQLESILKRALEFFIVQQERDQLLSEKMSVLHNMMMVDRVLSLGLLSAGMSHHMRNALVAVRTFLDLVPGKLEEEMAGRGTIKDADFWGEYHRNVQGQVDKIQSLLDDLWSAAEKPSFDFCDEVQLHELVGELHEQLLPQFAAKGIEVENRIPDTLPPLKVDKTKFRRLFELLFRDELASLPNGSKLVLTSQTVASVSASAPELQIDIQDNGPGMSESALRNVFDPFVPRSDSPSEYGINLMACYLIVHHHGGKMSVRSQEGQGTTFTMRLRTSSAQPPLMEEGGAFSQKLLLNQTLWQKVQGTE